MRFPIFKLCVAAGLALGLSACATYQPMIPAEATYVDKVNVEVRPPVASSTIADAVRVKSRREASRYGHSGAGKELKITVTELHYKDALQSLIIGDANYVKAHVAVLDEATGKMHGEFDDFAMDKAALNGVAGVIISVSQDKAVAEQRLAEGLAASVMAHVYGSAAAAEASKRQPVEYPETPAAAPAPAPAAPAKPAARKHEPKTAMAAPASSQTAVR